MICKACSGWRLPGRGRPLSQAGADNIGMDHRKQCFCATPAVREQCPSSTKGEADREVPETGSGS